jgi:proteic killer suppression protein
VIKSFADRRTAAVFQGLVPKRFPQSSPNALRRSSPCSTPPPRSRSCASRRGNRLEALKGARRGQHSIRINEQWRICFVWQGGNAHEVEIVDYH